jgi:membrane-associated phospholipid phosphatase
MLARRAGVRLAPVVVTVAAVLAVLPADEAVQDLVFRRVVSHEMRLLSNGFTLLGSTEVAVGILGGLVVVGYRTADATLWRASAGGLAGLAIGGAATQVVKLAACRARPRLVEGWGIGPPVLREDPGRRGFFHWPCLTTSSYHSFPSGHATTAFTLASVLSHLAPGRRRLWLLVAVGVGASRVFLNAHFLGDVAAGGLIGWWAGGLGQWVVARSPDRFGRPGGDPGGEEERAEGAPAVRRGDG